MTVERKTILSTCRQYRYCLWREWDRMNPNYAMFVGLNPSCLAEALQCGNSGRTLGAGEDALAGGQLVLCLCHLLVRNRHCCPLAVAYGLQNQKVSERLGHP